MSRIAALRLPQLGRVASLLAPRPIPTRRHSREALFDGRRAGQAGIH
jgi:hypothetical protein